MDFKQTLVLNFLNILLQQGVAHEDAITQALELTKKIVDGLTTIGN